MGLLLSLNLGAKATIPEIKSSFECDYFVSISILYTHQESETDQDKKIGNIDFQINSEITYFNIDQFKKTESKLIFTDAWVKLQESRKLTQQTDSLRKAYSALQDIQKDKIAALIIENEKKLLVLNEEIPSLFEKARIGENQYWQTVSDNEKSNFINKMKSFHDSIQKVRLSVENKSLGNTSVPDTIIYYNVDKLMNEVAVEPVTAIIYKIQVGSFKTELPESIAKAIKKLEILRKVDITKDDKGITYYTTGNLKSYQEALTLQTQVKLEGIKNPSVVAYKNNTRITLDEAKKLTNELNVKP